MLIAEVGQNFMGDIKLAKKLIESAKDNGADLCKFQLYDSQKLYGEYQPTELIKEQATMLFNYGEEIGIEVFFSVFDVERVGWCEEIGVKRYKIASRMNCWEVIHTIGLTQKPIILSIDDNVSGSERIVFPATYLYCVSQYPAKVNFKNVVWGTMYQGYSDHTIGLDAAMIAIARGAKIIEKHFSLSHQTGVDGAWSMDSSELRRLRRFYDIVQTTL